MLRHNFTVETFVELRRQQENEAPLLAGSVIGDGVEESLSMLAGEDQLATLGDADNIALSEVAAALAELGNDGDFFSSFRCIISFSSPAGPPPMGPRIDI